MKKMVVLALALALVLAAATASANQADVVVIGAGGAGMAAAIQAADDGATVVVLEKMNYAGGNTVRSEGGMNAAGTVFQAAMGIEDSPEVMIEDTMVGGKNLSDPELVRFMAENSAATVDWLTGLGMDLSEVAQGAGATNARMHRSAGGAKIGGVLTPVLMRNLEQRGITILYGVRATKLDTDESGAVTGVTATDKTGTEVSFTCNSVVLATGRLWRQRGAIRRLPQRFEGLQHHQPSRRYRRRHRDGPGHRRRPGGYGPNPDQSHG